MKRTRLIILVVLFILLGIGCSKAGMVYTDSFVSAQDAQYTYIDTEEGSVAETKSGYYFLSGHSNSYLYFYDKTKKQAIPVCNKPDCLHANEPDGKKIIGCNAFLGIITSHLKLYQDHLYFMIHENSRSDSVFALYQINLDGTAHQRVMQFKEYPISIQIHRGYLYYATTDSGTEPGKESSTKTTYRLCRLNLGADGAEPEIIDEGSQIYGAIDNLFAYGNSIYYLIHYDNDETLKTNTVYVNRYDIVSKTTSTFLSSNSARYTVFNDKFVYQIYKQGTFICDLDGKNPRKICDEYGVYTSNSKFLFIDNWFAALGGDERKLTIVDKNLNVVKSVPMPGMVAMPLGCSEEYYFLPSIKRGGSVVGSIACVPVDKISDNMSLGIFFEYVPKVAFPGIITE